jgi:hypothetical protein
MIFQLPLSGSLAKLENTALYLAIGYLFQLPLSGSLEELPSKYDGETYLTFNSLSRDHGDEIKPDDRPWVGSLFQLPLLGSRRLARSGGSHGSADLSTPSFGITVRDMRIAVNEREYAFNSLSRDHFRVLERFENAPIDVLSRDHSSPLSTYLLRSSTIDVLSRDHRARFRDFSALRGFLPRHPFARMIPETTI